MHSLKPKSLTPIQFEITPRPRRDGFTLNSSVLLFPIWYPTFEAAIGYARSLGRRSGCDVRVNNSDGAQVDLIECRCKQGAAPERRGLNSQTAHKLEASNMELRQQIASMTRLEWELLETSEREHRRFGWDLHEDLGQQLAGITFLASVLAKQFESSCPDLRSDLGELVSQLRSAISNTRNIARGLYPIGLENGGLLMVLEEFAAWITQVEGIPCEFRHSGNLSGDQEPRNFEVPESAAIHFYRIAQEAVNYLLKSGEARGIKIECALANSVPTMIVIGEGVSFEEPSLERAGLMDSRARMIGAEIEFKKTAGGGCAIACALKSRAEAGRAS